MSAGLLGRLPAALLVFLASAGALGAAVGGANAAGGGGLPEAFAVPEPLLGDRVSYEGRVHGAWGPGPHREGEPFTLADLEWVEGGRHRGADLASWQTDGLLVGSWRHDPRWAQRELFGEEPSAWRHDNRTLHFARGQPWLLLETEGYRLEQAMGRAEPLAGLPVASSRDRFRANHTETRFFEPGTTRHCLAGPWAARVARDAVLEVPSCVDGAFPDLAGGYRFVAEEMVLGIPAARLRHESGRNVSEVWLSPAIPYPLRILHRGDGRSIQADLAAYEPGHAPRGPPAPPQDPFRLQTAPLTPWALDDRGSGAPFPLSEAFARARDDPADAGLRNFLAAHPDAYVLEAAYHGEDRTGSFVRRGWSFLVADGPSGMLATVEQSFGPPLHPPAPQLPLGSPAYTYQTWTGPAHPDWTPPRWAVPELPTLASALEAWRLLADPEAARHGGAAFLEIACADTSCRKAEVTLSVGELSFAHTGLADLSSPGSPKLEEGHRFLSSLATLRFREGRWLLTEARDFVYGTNRSTGLGDAGPSHASGGEPLRPASAAAGAKAAWLPTPTQAAGVGAVAALVAALYWLWPALKSAPALGLFSRIRSDRLLDQPQRRLLMDLVEAEPGIHFQEMARRTGLANGVLVHHLRKLAESGLVVARSSGRYTCYFPRGTERGRMERIPALKAEGARQVLAAVAARPGLSGQEVAAITGLQPSTVSYHVQRLASAGLLHGNRDGRHVRLWPAEAARAR